MFFNEKKQEDTFTYDETLCSESGTMGKYARDASLVRKTRNMFGINQLIAAVADETGPYPGGTHASVIAIEMVAEFFNSDLFTSMKSAGKDLEIEGYLNDLFDRINTVLYTIGMNEDHNIKSSLSVVVMIEDNLYCMHIGTNRVLRVNAEGFSRLSADLSFFSHGLLNKNIPIDRAINSSRSAKNAGLGTDTQVTPLFTTETLKLEDTIALFTDGIGDYVSDQESHIIFNSFTVLTGACGRLLTVSKERGLKDNGSVVAFTLKPAKESAKAIKRTPRATTEKKRDLNTILYYAVVGVMVLMLLAGLIVLIQYQNKTMPFSFGNNGKSGSSIIQNASDKSRTFLVKDKESLGLDIFCLNGKAVDQMIDRFELIDSTNTLEIHPYIQKGTYTTILTLKRRTNLKVYEGGSRNSVKLTDDYLEMSLTRGTSVTFREEESSGEMILEMNGLGSPFFMEFGKENIIIKLVKDEEDTY